MTSYSQDTWKHDLAVLRLTARAESSFRARGEAYIHPSINIYSMLLIVLPVVCSIGVDDEIQSKTVTEQPKFAAVPMTKTRAR